MRSLLLLLVISFALPGLGAVAAETKADPYAQAVASYVAAADQQLQAIRREVEAEAKSAGASQKSRYATVYTGLERSEKALEVLKLAEPGDFDRLKADFEHTRDEMVSRLGEARRGG